jgi:hypothetical protein
MAKAKCEGRSFRRAAFTTLEAVKEKHQDDANDRSEIRVILGIAST